MVWFFLYSALFIGLAWLDDRKGQTPEAYFLNSRKSEAHQVGFSIAASCVGGSATVGMCGLAFSVGLPASWWLLSGACGLVLLRLFMIAPVRAQTGALTMPEMIRSRIGAGAHRAACCIIFCAWTAILAAQFAAMGRIVEGLTGLETFTATAAGSLLIVVYTWLGGQASVIKSDVIQLVVMTAGLVLLLALLVGLNPQPLAQARVEWFNEDFGFSEWARFMLLIGGSYIVCPMLFARVMSAKSSEAARRGTSMGIGIIVFTAFVITAIGIEARAFVPAGIEGDAVLSSLVGVLPGWVGVLFFLVMASAILSSADSCLITAATVAANDIVGRPSVKLSRILILVVSAAAFALAVGGKSVLGLLLTANTIYTCAVVAPLFAAFASGRKLHAPTALAAIAVAGAIAFASEVTGWELLTYIAAFVSVAGSIAAVAAGRVADALRHRQQSAPC